MPNYKAEELLAQAEEDAGGTEVGLFLKDERYTFPNPLFMDDDWNAEFAEFSTAEENARFLLGDEQFAKWRAAGGTSNVVMMALGKSQREMAAKMTDGTPTRSSTSSANARKRSRRR